MKIASVLGILMGLVGIVVDFSEGNTAAGVWALSYTLVCLSLYFTVTHA